ncbi:cytochrome c oxidase subunit 3 [Azospirillum canadense]|uniref:cytochrome c oxidase subunit 3 n=1 Tax=Azospirillum canadense TaxID=403962 RepID=UPI002227734C|nr:cytochrome c oxidase subunit 3 [Azospirillum canadense]MCW2239697.1 cytochrome c oxidase subunit 3 [Azospirillum canadense]
MSLIRTLTAKPWLEQTPEDLPALGRLPMPTARVGLVVFLAVVATLFALLVSAYVMRMSFGDWRPLPALPVLWLNTLVLALGSVALHLSVLGARRGKWTTTRLRFLFGGLCALAFLAGQLVAWRQLDTLGYFVAENPANTFFYLMTALHGLHILGGLVAWERTAVKLWSRSGAAGLQLSVELCATYWHFLLVVWLVLFGVLLADTQGLFVPHMHHGF